jgi:hypothetical protein
MASRLNTQSNIRYLRSLLSHHHQSISEYGSRVALDTQWVARLELLYLQIIIIDQDLVYLTHVATVESVREILRRQSNWKVISFSFFVSLSPNDEYAACYRSSTWNDVENTAHPTTSE